MASFFRSISLKIFGVSLGLLVLMVATALWSAHLTNQVHLQLRALSGSLFPLAMTLSDLHAVVQAEEAHTGTGLDTPDAAAVNQCRATATTQGATADRLVLQAQKYRDLGARVSVLERNRIKLAALQPMLVELDYQQNTLNRLMFTACEHDASDIQMDRAREQARNVERLSENITSQIQAFVTEGAVVVGDNQKFAMEVNLLMIGSAALVGLMLAWLVGRGLTRPIIRLQAGARAVSAGLLADAEVRVTSRDEIGDVTQAFNVMVEDLREKERIKEAFGQYVDPRVVAGLIGGGHYSTVGEKQVATLFFSDMAGFTAISERLAPSTLVDLVNAYFSEMAIPIRDRSGIIDKFIGDAIMAFWVPPFVEANLQASLACAAALDQFARLQAFQARVPDVIGLRRDIPIIDFRIGLASGEVVVGSIGSAQARSFTVMGDTVNFASRLEGANKIYGTRLLIDDATHDMAGDSIESREIDSIMVLGREEPVRIYELAAMAGDLPAERRGMFDLYAAGLAQYRLGKWDPAAKSLHAALQADPSDGPSKTLLARIEQFKATPPKSWDGTWRMTTK
ncbi:MAG: adenylate/guanylate cyclase domain-containing protein [Sphingomonas bacterium]